MENAEVVNQKIHEKIEEMSAKIESDKIDLITTTSERFRNQNTSENTESHFQKAKDLFKRKTKETLDHIQSKIQSMTEEKAEEYLLEKLEKLFLDATSDERDMLAKQIQKRFGQKKYKQLLMKATKKGYDFGKKTGLINPSEEMDLCVEVGYEVNEARNKIVSNTVNLIKHPVTTLKNWVNEAS